MSKPGAQTHGWGISLRFHGRTIADRSVRDGSTVRIGEDPACTLVVPGLGDAVSLAVADRLQRVPGLTGTIHRGSEVRPLTDEPSTVLAPGDRAQLQLAAHPEITLELRRQDFERLPLATLINVRELARDLALGAGLVAGLVLLVRHEAAVNLLEVKGEPDAPEDSALVRAMFAVPEPTLPELRFDHRWRSFELSPEPVAVPPPEPPPAPTIVPEAIAVPAEFAPRKRRKARAVEEDGAVFAMLGALNSSPDELAAFGVEGGVEGGVIGGVIGRDLLAERRPDGGVLGVIGTPRADTIDELVVDTVVEEVKEVQEIKELVADGPDDSDFVEAIMGPGAADDDAPVPGTILPLPPPPPLGDSHTEVDGGAVLRGAADGLAAVVPDGKCDDPEVVKKRELDVVFVVDVSTTMTFMLDRIEKQVAQVDAEARAQGLDPRYGLVVFVDDVELGNGGQPYADLAALQRDLATWRSFTAGNREIHSPEANLDWPENTLDAVHAAATGFAWRPTSSALRMIVHATDDDFGEAPAIQSGQAIQHTYAETATALRDAEVRMFSFAAKVGGQCECLDVTAGLFARFKGRPSLPAATGGAVFDIDEVARGKLGFAAAIGGAIRSAVCTRYPLAPAHGQPKR